MEPLHRLRIYLDTSVIGGYFDQEFAQDSRRLFAAIRAGRAVALVSETTTRELVPAPERVRQVLLNLPPEAVLQLAQTQEIDHLTQAYLAAGVVTERYREDAVHIAYATAYGADVLVSWNFRHMVNLNRIQQFNAVNLRLGYRLLEIRSPRELFVEADDTNGNDHGETR